MTNEEFTQNDEASGLPTDRRPLGYWLRTVDTLITREFASAFAGEDVTRRDWMLLNAVSGTVDVPGLAEKIARRGKRLRSLAERGWVAETDGRWELTDEGRAAQERLGAIVQGVREKVAGAVSAEDFATMTASLEAIARELGWDENERMPRGRRRGFGGRGRVPGFGPFGPRFAELTDEERATWAARMARHGFGPGVGHGPGFDHGHHGHGHGVDPRSESECGHPHGDAHGHGRHGKRGGNTRGHGGERGHGDARHAERAYERGFEAGFLAANPASADPSGGAAAAASTAPAPKSAA